MSALRRRRFAGVALAGLVVGSVLVVVIAAERPSFLTPTARPGAFPAWMSGPLHGLWPGLTRDPLALEWLISGLLAAMYALYLVAAVTASRVRPRWVLAAVLAVHLAFLLAPPLSYTDVFNYLGYARLGTLHHLNPYVVAPVAGPHSDPTYVLSNWHHLRSPYGPLFTLICDALVPLGLAGGFWAFKALLMIASLATLGLLWRCAELIGRSGPVAVVLAGLNPIVLMWGLGADHNDILMVLAVVAAAYLMLRSRFAAAAAMLVVAACLKAPAALLLPVFLAAAPPRRFLTGAAIAGVSLGALSLAAFGPHVPDLRTQSGLVTAVGPPNLLGLALGQGGETATLHVLIETALALTVAGCAVWTVRHPTRWLGAAGVAMLALIVSLSWSAPWYILWALPFVALANAPHRLRIAVAGLGVYLILAFMPAAVPLERGLHFNPTATALGLRHSAAIAAVFR